MKHTKKLIASILFSLLICNFYGCGNKPNEAASEEKVTAKEKVASKEEISNNVSKLEEKENNSVSKVENKLSQKTQTQKKHNDSSPKSSETKNSSNESDRAYFDNSVFMGDSLTEPLDYYGVLNPSSVLAVKGQNVIAARKFVNKLKDRNPQKIFLMYGSNDMEYFKKASDFKKNYGLLIKDIHEQVPDAKIYIISIPTVTEKAKKANPMFSHERYQDFTSVVKQLCSEHSIQYIDITPVLEEKNYYEPDGIHFISPFYKALVKFIRTMI